MKQTMKVSFKVYDNEEGKYTETDWSGRKIFLDQDGDLTTGIIVDGMLSKCDPKRYVYKFEINQAENESSTTSSTTGGVE